MSDSAWRDGIEILPMDLQDEVEPQLEEVLRQSKQELRADHVFLSFVQPENRLEEANLFRFSNGLWIGEERLTLHVLNIQQGLTGRAVRERRVIRYPNDTEASASYVETDPRVKAEIVGPVHFKGRVTGVLVFDRVSSNDAEAPPFSDAENEVFTTKVREIERILRKLEYATDDARLIKDFERIARESVGLTPETKRGYVAIKRPFGRVSYYRAGQNVENFLRLGTDEGLTGRVLLTGKAINCPNVLADPNYLASNEDIKSELVVPIKIGDETVGIINVESTKRGDYEAADLDTLTDKAEELAGKIRLHRTSSRNREGFDHAVGDLSARIARLRDGVAEIHSWEEAEAHILEEIVKALLQAVRATLPGGDCGFWVVEGSGVASGEPVSEGPPSAVERALEPGRRVLSEATFFEMDEARFLIAEFFASEGSHLGTVWARIASGTHVRDPRAKLDQLCLMATSAIKEWRREHRLREFLELTDLLAEPDPSLGVIEEVVRKVPRILQSDYCTLFHKVENGGERILVPTASSVPLPLNVKPPDGEPFYRWHAADGLTACAAVTGRGVCLQDVDRSEELEALQRELGIREIRWQGRLSEDEVELSTGTGAGSERWCRSFMAFPVFREGTHEVTGVVRTHRSRRHPRSGFSDEEQQQMSLIARLLSPILSRYLGSAPGSAPEPAE